MKSADRILTSHVGSLVRPDLLLAEVERFREGEVRESELGNALQQAVDDVVREQAHAGVDIVSDGEFPKLTSWSQYVVERLDGFERRPAPELVSLSAALGKDRQDYKEFYAEYEKSYGRAGLGKSLENIGIIAIVGPVSYKDAAVKADIERLKNALAKTPGVSGYVCWGSWNGPHSNDVPLILIRAAGSRKER